MKKEKIKENMLAWTDNTISIVRLAVHHDVTHGGGVAQKMLVTSYNMIMPAL